MIKEDKQLLLVDLCARLPYGVIMTNIELPETHYPLTCEDLHDAMFDDDWNDVPYLRPLSSMTEEEMEEMHNVLSPNGAAQYGWDGIKTPVSHIGDFLPYEYFSKVIDWLNANHFDFRGLIPRSCAIAVTDDNNPYKD